MHRVPVPGTGKIGALINTARLVATGEAGQQRAVGE
jgi:hypothetical protein